MNIPSEVMERYRDINVDHDWWDCTYDYWKSRLERMGLTDVEINFSGFWSQGDGASFTANINSYNLKKFIRVHGLRDRYRATYEMAKKRVMWGSACRYSSSHYYHECSVYFESDMESCQWDEDSDDLRDAMLHQFWYQADLERRDFDGEVQEILRGYMQDIYHALEEEYECLTSDEAVAEAIEANELYDPAELTE